MAAHSLLLVLLAVPGVLSFPWVARIPGVDSSLIGGHAARPRPRDNPYCPDNPNHVPAAPITSQFPYNGAINGLPGNGKGGYLVPAPGDTLHQFQPPGPLDIRGPCPGLNTAANHGFLARDGITTYNELVDAQQNVYNVGYDLANILAVAGVGLDGDLVGTGRLSIGCDATSRTALPGNVLADELGLDGHNQFEADTSLTRNDYFTAVQPGDDYRMNATLFTMMMDVCQGNCSLNSLALYRAQRFNQSMAENGEFFFGPGSLLLYGAATFLYELFPGADSIGTGNEATMMSFFGAAKDAQGNYYFNNSEQLPPNFRPRVDPYDGLLIAEQIIQMYSLYPVNFGGNFGPNNFNGMNYSTYITNGQMNNQTAADAMCQIFQTLVAGFPSEFGKVVLLPIAVETAITKVIAPYMANFGCPYNYLSGNP